MSFVRKCDLHEESPDHDRVEGDDEQEWQEVADDEETNLGKDASVEKKSPNLVP